MSRQDRIFRPELNAYVLPMYMPDEKLLFYDSMMITERHRIVINSNSKGQETSRVDIIGYTFKDFRRKTFTNYSSFSDTARKIYFREENIKTLQDDAKRFFNTTAKQYEHTLPISDTIINGNKCSRILRFFIENGDTTAIDTIYYIPEDQSPFANMDKLKVNNKSYSVIRTDYYHVIKGIKGFSSIDVVSYNLRKNEIKVFEAWRRSAAKIDEKKIAKTLRAKKK